MMPINMIAGNTGTADSTRCAACTTRDTCLGGTTSSGACGFGDSSVRELSRGQHLFRVGEGVNCVYMLRSGAVKTYLMTASGDEQILGFFSPGDIIGFDSLAVGKHGRNAVALVGSEVCRIPLESLLQDCGRDRGLLTRLLSGMGQEIQRLQAMLKMERLTAEQRIALFLINQARRQSRGEGVSLNRSVQLTMTRGEIGRFLDLATETVSRTLTKLKDAGLIAIERNSVEFRDLAALQRMAQGQNDFVPARIAA